MDKKKLLEMGLTEEQATKILKELKDGYVDKTTLEQKQTEITNLKEQVQERDKQIESLKKFEGDNEQLKTKLQEMEDTNKSKADEYSKTLLMERKKSAIRFALLEDEGGKPYDVSMVAGMFNLDNINLNEDGSIANGFKEQNENLRKEKAFLFATTEQAGARRTGFTPPDGSKGDPKADTPEAFGARLAQNKLQMMGIKPTTDK
jgi:predicted nuclease with TOPRIM domain